MAGQKETTINPPPVEREREPTLRDVMARLDRVEKAVTVTLPKQISESEARLTVLINEKWQDAVARAASGDLAYDAPRPRRRVR